MWIALVIKDSRRSSTNTRSKVSVSIKRSCFYYQYKDQNLMHNQTCKYFKIKLIVTQVVIRKFKIKQLKFLNNKLFKTVTFFNLKYILSQILLNLAFLRILKSTIDKSNRFAWMNTYMIFKNMIPKIKK